jgi:eukaryotic-like serine/threonine-protein kinase
MREIVEPEPARESSFLAKELALRTFARQRSSARPGRARGSHDPLILAPGDLVAGRYEVGPIIGAGALGIVYKARHVELDRRVALKVIRPDAARDAAAMRHFAREARALSALHNEHIVRVHDAGTLGSGLPYLVMELLEGSTLRGVLDNGPLPPWLAVDIALQICSALADAHRANIIHRDVRPENVFLARYSNTGAVAKLLDFGTAIFAQDAGNCTKTRRGGPAPDYLSPEQLLDAYAVDARSDLWVVGVLLYEMIGGTTPFAGSNKLQTCLHIAEGAIRPLDVSCPDVEALAAVIQHCLQVDPARRPQSAEALGLELEQLQRQLSPGRAR